MAKVLVVDDEQAITTLLKYNLEKAGYEVKTVNNGNDALRINWQIRLYNLRSNVARN